MATHALTPAAATPLTEAEITAALATLPGWDFSQNTLAKTFLFSSFRDAIVFMHRASFVAEELDHHPYWSNNHDAVRVQLTTRDAGHRVTLKDVTLAQNLQLLARDRELPSRERKGPQKPWYG